jgi:hypothetical protein
VPVVVVERATWRPPRLEAEDAWLGAAARALALPAEAFVLRPDTVAANDPPPRPGVLVVVETRVDGRSLASVEGFDVQGFRLDAQVTVSCPGTAAITATVSAPCPDRVDLAHPEELYSPELPVRLFAQVLFREALEREAHAVAAGALAAAARGR